MEQVYMTAWAGVLSGVSRYISVWPEPAACRHRKARRDCPAGFDVLSWIYAGASVQQVQPGIRQDVGAPIKGKRALVNQGVEVSLHFRCPQPDTDPGHEDLGGDGVARTRVGAGDDFEQDVGR